MKTMQQKELADGEIRAMTRGRKKKPVDALLLQPPQLLARAESTTSATAHARRPARRRTDTFAAIEMAAHRPVADAARPPGPVMTTLADLIALTDARRRSRLRMADLASRLEQSRRVLLDMQDHSRRILSALVAADPRVPRNFQGHFQGGGRQQLAEETSEINGAPSPSDDESEVSGPISLSDSDSGT
ncbi:uncharacterized protein [Physcomitrium patens]|uniref:Uncharacterized protein n=1 Tax=Physcomitrium patens TaxID=3218 RepID=A0A2K1JIX7_PHYPA|nr:uncharacterized protein LOC112291227 [Physcomitrium patens]PNR41502.1 hypothetical protein PHYPA_018905 [Physcomitrium patens]|eukprot:XP_024394135.1 uncharacterized protein LOC112291227 [Physcomitrella patens]